MSQEDNTQVQAHLIQRKGLEVTSCDPKEICIEKGLFKKRKRKSCFLSASLPRQKSREVKPKGMSLPGIPGSIQLICEDDQEKLTNNNQSISQSQLTDFWRDEESEEENGVVIGGIPLGNIYENSEWIKPFLCNICSHVAVQPVRCSECNSLFCTTCIQHLNVSINLSSSPKPIQSVSCPHCNSQHPFDKDTNDQPISSTELKPDFNTQQFLHEISVDCVYKVNGCQEVIPYADYEDHLKVCPKRTKICIQCGENYICDQYEQHKLTCQERLSSDQSNKGGQSGDSSNNSAQQSILSWKGTAEQTASQKRKTKMKHLLVVGENGIQRWSVCSTPCLPQSPMSSIDSSYINEIKDQRLEKSPEQRSSFQALDDIAQQDDQQEGLVIEEESQCSSENKIRKMSSKTIIHTQEDNNDQYQMQSQMLPEKEQIIDTLQEVPQESNSYSETIDQKQGETTENITTTITPIPESSPQKKQKLNSMTAFFLPHWKSSLVFLIAAIGIAFLLTDSVSNNTNVHLNNLVIQTNGWFLDPNAFCVHFDETKGKTNKDRNNQSNHTLKAHEEGEYDIGIRDSSTKQIEQLTQTLKTIISHTQDNSFQDLAYTQNLALTSLSLLHTLLSESQKTQQILKDTDSDRIPSDQSCLNNFINELSIATKNLATFQLSSSNNKTTAQGQQLNNAD